ncbi:hypothetical protein [Paenibacillus uliginis]
MLAMKFDYPVTYDLALLIISLMLQFR